MTTFAPAVNDDFTLTAAIVQPVALLGDALLLTLALPAGQVQGLHSGRYVLARCGAQTLTERNEGWQVYFRRPLFFGALAGAQQAGEVRHELCEVVLPPVADPGYRWLAEQPAGSTLNLIGPLGQGFVLQPLARNLLLVTDAAHLPLLFGLIAPLLNRGGRVALLLQTTAPPPAALRQRLPIPVELRLATTEAEWRQHLAESGRWADQVCAALPNDAYVGLAAALRQVRFRLESGFAQVLVAADLACGIGACLACTIPLADGSYTRACIHGPVFDLKRLVA